MPTTKAKDEKKVTKTVKNEVETKKVTKKEVIAAHAKHDKDTGSAEVQVAILTNRINELTEHLKEHKKDNSSRRGLLALVGKRRRLLNYIKSRNEEVYADVIKKLKLRK